MSRSGGGLQNGRDIERYDSGTMATPGAERTWEDTRRKKSAQLERQASIAHASARDAAGERWP